MQRGRRNGDCGARVRKNDGKEKKAKDKRGNKPGKFSLCRPHCPYMHTASPGWDSTAVQQSTFTAPGCLEQGDSGHTNTVTSRASRQIRGCWSSFKTPHPLRIRSSFFRKKKQNRVPRVPEPCGNLLLQKNECKCFVIFLQDIFCEKMFCAEGTRSAQRLSNRRVGAARMPASFRGAGERAGSESSISRIIAWLSVAENIAC